MAALISPTSSKRSVPPSASTNTPSRARSAPVKAPRTWPKSSDSRRLSASAAQLNGTKGLSRLGLASWTACATRSLPVPVSPWMIIDSEVGAYFWSFSKSAIISDVVPTSPPKRSGASSRMSWTDSGTKRSFVAPQRNSHKSVKYTSTTAASPTNVPLSEFRSTRRRPLGVACTSAWILLALGSARTSAQFLERPMCRRSGPTAMLAAAPMTSMRPLRSGRTCVFQGCVVRSSASTSATMGTEPADRCGQASCGARVHCASEAFDHGVVNVADRTMRRKRALAPVRESRRPHPRARCRAAAERHRRRQPRPCPGAATQRRVAAVPETGRLCPRRARHCAGPRFRLSRFWHEAAKCGGPRGLARASLCHSAASPRNRPV